MVQQATPEGNMGNNQNIVEIQQQIDSKLATIRKNEDTINEYYKLGGAGFAELILIIRSGIAEVQKDVRALQEELERAKR